MQQNYQDAMAIVASYGRPDLFITMTCNPKWREITENLLPGQRASDRPDIVARVFHMKLTELLDDITKRHIFGVTIADLHVIEFQKRGLPHAHMLFILRSEDKVHNVTDIDKIVCAEIPNKDTDPELFNTIRSSMIHGPCGVLNPNCVFMVDGTCTKGYPKQFSDVTIENVNGYPCYRRRDDGRTIVIGQREVDDRWIVPYNPWLSKKYDAHINVEICSSVKSIKYLFKYVYKGHDCATLELRVSSDGEQQNVACIDEISTYLDARYVSAPEAMWRLLEKRMHYQSHAVIRLAVHLEQQQSVYFRPGQEEAALERSQVTTLLAWFDLNSRDPAAHQWLYTQIPKHYVYQKATGMWTPRKRGGGNVIGRMYYVSPRDTERFHLRLLLLHVRGATSYRDLRTVAGQEAETVQAVCRLHNLLEDDDEWDNCLAEAASLQMPTQLRRLFVTICIFCQPGDPLQLWLDHKLAMMEDFSRVNSAETAENLALLDIEQLLSVHGFSCDDYHLPSPVPSNELPPSDHDYIEQHIQGVEQMAQLNAEQREAVETILCAVDDYVQSSSTTQGHCFFIDGPGGTGGYDFA